MDEASESRVERPRFEIFRASDARDYAEHDCMEIEDVTPAIAAGLTAFAKAGSSAGQQVEMVYSRPEASLTRVWFKSGYPLPLHAHNADCVYFIIAGSIQAGTETLGPGDGFFVGSDVPYTYTPGPEGVEVLEFRPTDTFNIRFMAKNGKAWDKTVARVDELKDRWAEEARPSAPERTDG